MAEEATKHLEDMLKAVLQKQDHTNNLLNEINGKQINHDGRISELEKKSDKLDPRMTTVERFVWGGAAIVSLSIAVGGFIVNGIQKNNEASARNIIQQELSKQDELSTQVVKKLKTVYDFN